MFSFTHPAMGTTYSLFLYAQSAAAADAEAEKAFEIVDDVDALLSNYRPQSELSRINRMASTEAVTTDPETFEFLEDSLRWSAISDGGFDITVGALMKSWGFFRSSGHVPSADELNAVRAKTGWQKVVLDPQRRTVRFTAPGLELDPGGIGKGFAVDRVIEQLRSDGVRAALLSAGSSTIYALGAPPGKAGWVVNVPDPRQPAATLGTVVLHDTSLSTASCAEKHFVFHGHLYCHIMDPRLAMPVEGRLQATVITPVATDGDALSNVMFVGDAVTRARVMAELPEADGALVISDIPVENHEDAGGTKTGDAAVLTSCESYRWPGALPGICHAVGAAADGRREKK
jgi:thiamine biosynthesis lipoprotein